MAEAKEFLFHDAARQALLRGIDQLADVTCITLGPKGKSVGIHHHGFPEITSDGGSIVEEVELKDPFENLGVSFGKEVTSKIKERCGDGTTTGIVLFRELVKGGIKNIAAGESPILIKRGMDKTLNALLKAIDQMAVSIKEDEVEEIARVSAGGDTEVGKMIATAFQKVGKDGVISIEQGKKAETEIEVVEGLCLDRGYVSPYFCTNAEKMLAELNNPYILITDKKISSVQELLPILQGIVAGGRELLLIADDIEADALSTLVINKLKGNLKVTAIKAPGFGDQRKALLEDLAILTGGQFISEEKGLSLHETTVDSLGRAERIVITKEKTTIIKGGGAQKAINNRIAEIDCELKTATSSYDSDRLKARKAKLAGGVALIRVGAYSEAALKQKKQLFEDSLNSTRAALEEGIVPGGGVALYQAAKTIKPEPGETGACLLLKAVEAPLRQLITNSNRDPSTIVEEIQKKGGSFGFNVLTEKVENLKDSHIMDPAKVVKSALMHAVSVAGMVLLSEALLVPAKEE